MPNDGKRKFNVFLSHSHDDGAVVRDIAERLESKHHLCAWLDKWILVPGQSWQQEMQKGLEEAECCAACIGVNTPTGWFRQEIECALNRQATDTTFRVIPVLLPGAREENVSGFLQLRTWIDLRDGINDGEQFHLLVCGIKGIPLGRRPVPNQSSEETDIMTKQRLQQLQEWRQLGILDTTVAVEYQRKTLDTWMEKY